MVYDGEKPVTSQSALNKLQTNSGLNRSSVTSLNNETTGNMQGYIHNQKDNTSTLNKTTYSGKRFYNYRYVHNDWNREKKTKFSFQGSDNRLMRLKALKTPNQGNK